MQQQQTARSGRVSARTIQVRYNRLVRNAEETVFPSCEKQELGVLVRVPLESGFLTSKYDSGAVFDSSDVRARKYDPHARLGPGLVSAASGRELRDPRL